MNDQDLTFIIQTVIHKLNEAQKDQGFDDWWGNLDEETRLGIIASCLEAIDQADLIE